MKALELMDDKYIHHKNTKWHWKNSDRTKTLIVGTFNPRIDDNKAKFFYSRPRNSLWKILPAAVENITSKDECEKVSLCKCNAEIKERFAKDNMIGFVDLIKRVDRAGFIERCGGRIKFGDKEMSGLVGEADWEDVLAEIARLKNHLDRVGFTRRTLDDVPYLREPVQRLEKFCCDNKIYFKRLLTPARGWSKSKQEGWNVFMRTTYSACTHTSD